MTKFASASSRPQLVANRILASGLCACALLFAANSQAQSIIKQPGNHIPYSVDLEPHLLLALDDSYYGSGGFGLGMRATIPFLRNGPISNINNDMGIGFGLDWVTKGACNRGYYWQPNNYYYYDCSAFSLYVPVVLQWNFYITDIITVYGEPGFALRYSHLSWSYNGPGGIIYPASNSYTDPVLVLAGGAKFMFGKSVGLNVRVGFPYFSVGVSILL
jgi:hypothetical protein